MFLSFIEQIGIGALIGLLAVSIMGTYMEVREDMKEEITTIEKNVEQHQKDLEYLDQILLEEGL